MRLYAWLKWLVARVTVVANYCRDCGRAAEAFTVSDQVWASVTGRSEPLCFRCFDRQAGRQVWRVTPG